MSDIFSDNCLDSLARVEALAESWDEHDRDLAEAEAEQRYLASDEADTIEREHILNRLAQTVYQLDQYAAKQMSAGARLQVASALKNAEECLRDTRKDLEGRIVEELPVGAKIGDAEIGWDKRWVRVRWSELMPKVVALIADTPGVVWSEDGERLPGHVVAENLIDALHACVGWSSPKRPGLAELGIDLDEYAERKAGPVIRWAKS